MKFTWLKNAMPRGLYTRAALILILPVILLQLLISVIFIQRHFEGVTESMTRSMSIDLRYVQEQVEGAETEAELAAVLDRLNNGLEIAVTPAETPPPEQDLKTFRDLTGNIVIASLRRQLDSVAGISLPDRRRVHLWLDTAKGPMEIRFLRNRVSASNPHQLLVIMVVIGGLMTLVAYIFLRNQLRPIKKMGDAAAAYGKGRIVSFTPTGAVEVRAAGMAFLDMRNRIERQTQSRTLMLSGVSHDLRTPLTRMRLGLSLLDDAEAAPLLQDVEEMQHMVDGFLDFAQSDVSDTLMQTVPQDIVKDTVKAAKRSGQNLRKGEDTGPRVQVAMRPLAIRRALDNLVGNALRYGTEAMITVSISERAVRFTIEDNGPGIPAERRDDAVKPFMRLDPSRNQNAGSGVGLGLSIVTDVARSHGGTLLLGESTSLGGLRAELVIAR